MTNDERSPNLESRNGERGSLGVPSELRGAPKAPIIPAQPSGLGNRTGEAKALKARSISIPGITLVEFGPMPWRQEPVSFLKTALNGLLARCGTNLLLVWESEQFHPDGTPPV